ncbi:MAG: PEGA domain-containing protein [Patescibacteria group bacterium]
MIKHIHTIPSIAIRIILTLVFAVVLVAIIGYARGYRLNTEDTTGSLRGISSTGIISVSAFPKASKVYINGKLKGVTDLNVTLPPGDYKVEVKKEGYTEWQKQVKLQGEIVITLDALLLPKNPSLQSLTNLGIVKAIPYHEANKIILFSDSDDEEKDGVYVFDSNSKPLSFYAPLKILILKKYLPDDVDLVNTKVSFSPDLQQAIFEFPSASGSSYSYLFSLGEEVTQPFDISSSKDAILQTWSTDKSEEVTKILETFPKELRPIAVSTFSILSFSPDQTKVLYQAKEDYELKPILKTEIIGSNQSVEERSLKKGELYVYDKKEDKNYHFSFDSSMIKSPTPSLSSYRVPTKPFSLTPTPTVVDILTDKTFPIVWHSDSKHISVQGEKEIVMVDYDGANKRTIYSGPFEPGFFFITNSGKLYILTNLNPQNNKYADLYEIGIQ